MGRLDGQENVRKAFDESELVDDLAAVVCDGFLGCFELGVGGVFCEGDLRAVGC
jgi:hypothetical protein